MIKTRLLQQMRFGAILAFILVVFVIHSANALTWPTNHDASVGDFDDAAKDIGPFGAAALDEVPPGYSRTLFDVKFLDDSDVQASENRVTGLSVGETTALDNVSRIFSVVSVTPVFGQPAIKLDLMRERGERMSSETLPDLSTWMRYEIASSADAEAFMGAMRKLETVYSIEPAALPSPPPAVTPDFSGNQGYLTAATVGIDALYSWGIAGGDGTGITIFDVEYDWNQTHEDLSKIHGIPLLVNPGDSNNSPFANDHGTAVVGEVSGDDNGIGVTGISKGASIGLAPTVTTNLGFNPANAINLATTAAVPGDVILIEQQADVCGLPSGSYGPQEWISTVYAAIQTATANGVVVVEAAGNGNVDLDQAACGTTFDRNIRDSGAIIVGAGGTGGSNLQRLGFSSYGSRLDLQGWGQNVMTTGYGGYYTNPDDPTNPDNFYTSTFSGTSSASPIVTGAAANLLGIAKNQGVVLSPTEVRSLLVQTGTAQLPNENQKIGPRPNLAQAVPQIPLPEIDISPNFFDFVVLTGATDSDTMNIANLGNADLDWSITVYSGDTNVVGDWTLYFDWECNGNPSTALLNFVSDFTFTDNFLGSGTWSQLDNKVTWVYDGGTEYVGYIAGDGMAGTMASTSDPGCWETNLIPPPPAAPRLEERTPSGSEMDQQISLDRTSSYDWLISASVYNPATVSWLSATPSSGTTADSATDPVIAAVDSNMYTTGEYGLMVVHSNDADEATIAVPVTLTEVEQSHADFSASPTTGSKPLTVSFTNLSSGDYDSCTWSFGDGDFSNNCLSPSHEYLSLGKFAVKLTVNGPGGIDSETKTAYITVEKPKAYLPLIIGN